MQYVGVQYVGVQYGCWWELLEKPVMGGIGHIQSCNGGRQSIVINAAFSGDAGHFTVICTTGDWNAVNDMVPTGTFVDLYKSFLLLLLVKYREIDDHRIILKCQ